MAAILEGDIEVRCHSYGRRKGIIIEDPPYPQIIVGDHPFPEFKRELDDIAIILEQLGFDVVRSSDTEWARDSYYRHGSDYFRAGPREYQETRCGSQRATNGLDPGIGGLFVEGETFVLSPFSPYGKVRMQRYYPDKRVYKYPNIGGDHIDLYVGSVNSVNALVVDPDFHCAFRRFFDELESEEEVEVLVTDENESRLFPTNFFFHNYSPMLGTPFVLANRATPRTADEIEGLGVDVIRTSVDITHLTQTGGSIRCVTNTFHDRKVLDELGIDYWHW